MDDQNPRAVLGGNNPPDPIDAICAAYEGARMESENWLDGTLVENEGQMEFVDALRKDMREFRISLEAGQKSATAPLYDVYKAEMARWKPVIEDVQRIEKGLVALNDGFKRKLAAEKAEIERKAQAEAAAARRAVEEAARNADAADLEAQRATAEAMRKADEAQKRAAAASKDTVKGMRQVTRYEIDNHRAALHDIATNDRDAITAFIEDYVRRNHKDRRIDGVRVWTDLEAY